MSEKPARPSQVSLAGWLVTGASLFVVVGMFDQIATVDSIETRERLTSSAHEFSSLGLSVDEVISVLRVSTLLAGGMAAATAVFGIFLLRDHKPSRWGLTALAVPLFLLGTIAGDVVVGVATAVIAASALMLWTQPGRSWFDGTEPPAPATRVDPSGLGAHRSASAPESLPPPTAPPLYGSLPAAPPGGSQAPTLDPGRASRPGATAPTRPRQVVWACVATWYFCGLTMIGLAFFAASQLSDSDATIAQARESSLGDTSQISDSVLLTSVIVVYVALAVWALAAMVLAVFVWRGHEVARILMMVSAGVAGVLLVITALGSIVALPVALACGITLRLLVTPPARDWCRRASPRR